MPNIKFSIIAVRNDCSNLQYISRIIRMEKESHQVSIKVVFAGKHGVGKTSLLRREAEGVFTKQWITTIGVEFKIKRYKVGNVMARAMLWDTAGQQRFRSIQAPYFKGAHAALICFDLSDKDSFINIQKQLEGIRNLNLNTLQTMQIYLVGCKSDLDPQVFTDEILVYSQRNNCKYFQTSAKQNEGVSEFFQEVVRDSVHRQLQIMAFSNKQSSIQLKQNSDIPQKKRCC